MPDQTRARAAAAMPPDNAAEPGCAPSVASASTFDPSAPAASDGIFGLPHGVDDAVPAPRHGERRDQLGRRGRPTAGLRDRS
jgi:hypothetical protein